MGSKGIRKEANEWVKFAEIEKDVQLDHLRPYYQMASYGVHANSKGLIVDVGHPKLGMVSITLGYCILLYLAS